MPRHFGTGSLAKVAIQSVYIAVETRTRELEVELERLRAQLANHQNENT